MAGEFVTIARVRKTQGRRGEVAADLHSDFPERFKQRKRLFALMQDNSRRELQVEEFWGHKGFVILKFAGVESISDAEKLIGAEIQIPASERAQLEQGTEYVSDLEGCAVWVEVAGSDVSREIGRVADVQFGAGEAPVLVIQKGKQEYLVPFAEEYVANVDVKAKRIDLKLPEGMLEINAPMNAEEKQRQQRK